MNPHAESLGTSIPVGVADSSPSVTPTALSHIYPTTPILANPAARPTGEEIAAYAANPPEVDSESVIALEEINGGSAGQCHIYYATADQQTSDEDLPAGQRVGGGRSEEAERGFRLSGCSPRPQLGHSQLHHLSHNHKSRLSESPVPTGVKVRGSTAEKISRTNLYIKGLPDSFNDEQLWHLPPDGTQIRSVKAAMDDDYRCRGYGFIDFISELAANEAMRCIKETHPSFIIKFAKENEKDRSNLYVTNLPKSWTTKDSDQLKSVFERFGPIQSAFVMMERTTNRTTGVGFVRFANERDALDALESTKSEHIVLPDCTAPVEAKFADKHNPETRRRRYPASVPLSTSHQINNLFHTYPLGLTNSVNHLVTQDPLATFLTTMHQGTNNSTTTTNNGNHSTSPKGHLSGSSANLQSLHLKVGEYTQRLTQTLLTNSAKLSAANFAIADFPTGGTLSHPQLGQTLDPALATLTAAAAAAGLLNNYFHVEAGTGPGLMSPTQMANSNATGGLLPANPLSFFTAAGTLSSPETAILNPSLYGCPVFGTDFYRTSQVPTTQHSAQVAHQQSQQQQQHQRNLFEATIAAMNGSGGVTSLLPGLPDLSPFIHYPGGGLLSSHQAATGLGGSTSCLRSSTASLAPLYAHPANGLVSPETLLNQPGSQLMSESIGLIAQKSLGGLQPWLLASQHQQQQVNKNGTIEANLPPPNHNLNV